MSVSLLSGAVGQEALARQLIERPAETEEVRQIKQGMKDAKAEAKALKTNVLRARAEVAARALETIDKGMDDYLRAAALLAGQKDGPGLDRMAGQVAAQTRRAGTLARQVAATTDAELDADAETDTPQAAEDALRRQAARTAAAADKNAQPLRHAQAIRSKAQTFTALLHQTDRDEAAETVAESVEALEIGIESLENPAPSGDGAAGLNA